MITPTDDEGGVNENVNCHGTRFAFYSAGGLPTSITTPTDTCS